MTLQEILTKEQEHRCEGGMFGIDACKKHIAFVAEYEKTSLYNLLEEYVNKANNDIFFNDAMVLACWELINEV